MREDGGRNEGGEEVGGQPSQGVWYMYMYLALFPGLRPDFISQPWRKAFLHGCEIKSGRRPGNEATCTETRLHSALHNLACRT